MIYVVPIELGLIIVLLLLLYFREYKPNLSINYADKVKDDLETQVRIVKKIDGKWTHHSYRSVGHPDIKEAMDTPGLAVVKDGVLHQGRQ